MKSLFLKTLVGVAAAASAASALSLYDTAPNVGLPESQAARYDFSVSGGFDTNPRGSTNKNQKNSSAYVQANLHTSFADEESLDHLKYDLRLGGTHYLNTQNEGERKYYSDCNADVSLTHAFSSSSRYSLSAHISYLPEPGYDNGFSSAGMRGDTLSWSMYHSYSEALDDRWSWNAGLTLSGTKYEEKSYSVDDRQYYGGNLGVNYRESDRITYTISSTYRDELRSHGFGSQSVFLTGGAQYALDPVSSASATVGVQGKMMNHRNTMNPTLDLGYRRRVSDGLSLNAYVKYSDENVDNYSSYAATSYRSTATWRAGVYGTYALSPDVSYIFRMQVMQSQYRKPTSDRLKPATRYTLNPSVRMNYHFTPSLTGTLSANYTFYHYERGEMKSMYNKWQFSAGLVYRF